MAGFREEDKALFPIQSISSIVQIFQNQLENSSEPDLALLSILVGAVENSLTCNRTFTSQESTVYDEPKLPAVEYHIAEALYTKFHAVIKGAVDLTVYDTKYATRELIKKVSDVIWNSLTRSYYKDRAHLQSLYSYLTANKLDCFGVAYAVVAGCQVLGFKDVHLAMSEDHAWVVYGEHGSETAEVTWHGMIFIIYLCFLCKISCVVTIIFHFNNPWAQFIELNKKLINSFDMCLLQVIRRMPHQIIQACYFQY